MVIMSRRIVHNPIDFKTLIENTEKELIEYPLESKERVKIEKFLKWLREKEEDRKINES
jgi:hypothetical protein